MPQAPSSNTRAPSGWAIVAALGLALLWGGNAVAIKVGVGGLPPLSFVTARTALGLLFLIGWAVVARVPLRPQRGELIKLIALSLLFSVQVLGLVYGTSLSLAVRSTVLMNTFPFFTAVFAHLALAGDRLTWRTSAASILGLAGVALAVAVAATPTTQGDAMLPAAVLVGDAAVLASAAGLGLRQVVSKRLMSTMPPERLLVWMMALSVPLTGVLAWGLEREHWQPLSGAQWGATLYTGVMISGFGFVAYQGLLRRYRASAISVPSLATPLCGVLLGWALLGEQLPIALGGGAILVAAGIYVVNARRIGANDRSDRPPPRPRFLLRSLPLRDKRRSGDRSPGTPR